MTKLISVLMIASLAGCSWFETKGVAVKDAMVDCAKGKTPSIALEVLADVTSIVLAGGKDWQAKLDELGTSVGKDALACAVSSVAKVFAIEAPKAGDSPLSAAAGRAHSYVQGIRFAGE